MNFTTFSYNDLCKNVMSGGNARAYQFRMLTDFEGTCLSFFGRTEYSHRAKFVHALPMPNIGNKYEITVEAKLGASATADEATVEIELLAYMPNRGPVASIGSMALKKTEWSVSTFVAVQDDPSFDSVGAFQKRNNGALAEEILFRRVDVKLLEGNPAPAVYDTRKTLWIFGDSIVADYDPLSVTKGWGTYMKEALTSEKLRVVNLARGGFSTKTYLDSEGQCVTEEFLKGAKEGDLMILSLGINDFSSSSTVTRVTLEEYTENLVRFAELAKKRGVSLTFVTLPATVDREPILNYRRSFAEAMLSVGSLLSIPTLDMNAAFFAHLLEYRKTHTREEMLETYFSDTTHEREAGSKLILSMIFDLLKNSDSALKPYLA